MKAIEGHRYYNERTKLETVIPLQHLLFCMLIHQVHVI